MATHSSILPWEMPWTGETGRLQSMGSQESDMTEQLNNNNNNLVQGVSVCLCVSDHCSEEVSEFLKLRNFN